MAVPQIAQRFDRTADQLISKSIGQLTRLEKINRTIRPMEKKTIRQRQVCMKHFNKNLFSQTAFDNKIEKKIYKEITNLFTV